MADSGISWDLEVPHLPNNRRHYERAPFASLWTQRPEDADKAYDLYRGNKRMWDYQNPFFALWGGRPFNVPVIVSTAQYESQWSDVPAPDAVRAQLAIDLSALNGDELRMLQGVGDKLSAVSRIVYRLENPGPIAHSLIDKGWCESGETKPTKKYPVSEPAIRYARDDLPLLRWELGRRTWILELMVRYQFAYEATQGSMIGYRESGVASHVEVLGAKECCTVCRELFQGKIPVSQDIEIPPPGCTAPDGCTCGVAPILDHELGT